MKKKIAGLLALLFAMAAALTGCSRGTIDNAAEAMNVEGVSVPLGELNFYLRYQQVQMQRFYGSLFGENFMNQDLMGLGVPYGETVRDSVIETMEEFYIVEAHAEELGISLSDEEKAAAAESAKAFLAANDQKTLSAMSADEPTVTHVLELMALQSKARADRAATIDREVAPEEAAQKRISYVMSSKSEIDEEGNETELTEVELAERMVQMTELLADAKESGDLSAAAESRNLTASTLTYGKNDSALDESVRKAADALSEGELSDVIEAEDGYYIVYMESTYDEEATQEEVEMILSERETEAYNAWYDSLKEAAEITTNEELIGTLSFERNFMPPSEEEEPSGEETPEEEELSGEEMPGEGEPSKE